MQLHSLSDADLWSLIVGDNYRAFTVLFERYWLRLYRTAQRYIRSETACEEVVHDLFLNLWSRRKFLGIRNVEHYLKASIRYQVYSHQKRSKNEVMIFSEDLEAKNDIVSYNLGSEKIHSDELEQLLDSYLNVLPVRCRQIFLLSRRDYLTNDEIANMLNISKRSVENQLTIALRHLRFNLKEIMVLLISATQIF
ncbi:sigma-70 family RNA polymerase sigma factor [Mucilaginibacter daejeonensis]|uniref:sigma-70 family RNA polymerase sigma factor n=1 Tax=Mucilaginibacter daejeonensis TaxID=398049 RepID=UPI001D1784F1|nr:sigma-70 family RNA polymerase sigma factor [Mucilaginibacter daejeonensis]UEG52130.1 sigma-70 family RNA polymerase sigma factor [Mucilaginibacter daejeonensis]